MMCFTPVFCSHKSNVISHTSYWNVAIKIDRINNSVYNIRVTDNDHSLFIPITNIHVTIMCLALLKMPYMLRAYIIVPQ